MKHRSVLLQAVVVLLVMISLSSCGKHHGSATVVAVIGTPAVGAFYNPAPIPSTGGYYAPSATFVGYGGLAVSTIPPAALDPRNWNPSTGVAKDDFALFPLTPPSERRGAPDTGPYLPRVANFTIDVQTGTGSTAVAVGVVSAFGWASAPFDLVYDPTLYDPVAIVNEGFLGKDGEVVYGASASQPGYLSVNVGRYWYDTPPAVSGGGSLVTIVFANQPFSVPQGNVRYLTGGTTF